MPQWLFLAIKIISVSELLKKGKEIVRFVDFKSDNSTDLKFDCLGEKPGKFVIKLRRNHKEAQVVRSNNRIFRKNSD